MIRYAAAVVLAACGGAASPAPATPTPTPAPAAVASPTLADCAWLTGTWHSAQLDSRWQVVDGALYGIALHDGGFEVNIIDDSDDDGKPAPITLFSAEGGKNPMTFALRTATARELVFEDPHQRRVHVVKTTTGWRGEFTEPGHAQVAIDMQPTAPAEAPALAAADREFAADTLAHGADGWAAHFAPDGAMWSGKRIEGAAIHDSIAKTLAKGPLRWQPVASGARGDVGYTLGTFAFGDPVVARGSYATIWRRQPDGSWKVVFDLGRPGGA